MPVEHSARRRRAGAGTARIGGKPDDRAQIMLLTAFVLVIGFVALTAMVARVSQLPEATRQSTDRPIFTESKAVAEGVQMMLERMDALNAVDEDDPIGPRGCDPAAPPAGVTCYLPLYLQRVADAAAHLERLESARGFRLQFADPPATCTIVGGRPVVEATFRLHDVETLIRFTARHTVADAADVPEGAGGDEDTAATPYNTPYLGCPTA